MQKKQKNPNPTISARTSKNLDLLYNYIKEYILTNGYSPSVREQCKALNDCSTSTIFYYLLKMEKANLIRRKVGTNRAIEVVALTNTTVNKVATMIVNRYDNIESLDDFEKSDRIIESFVFGEKMFDGDDLFAIEVADGLMANVGLLSGDIAIFNRAFDVADADIICCYAKNQLMIRRYFKDVDCYRLKPEAKGARESRVKGVELFGKLVGSFRRSA